MFDVSMDDVISEQYDKIENRVDEFLQDAQWPKTLLDIEDDCRFDVENIPTLKKFGEEDISVKKSEWIQRESPYDPYRKISISCSVPYSGNPEWFKVMPSVGKIGGTRPLSGDYNTSLNGDRVVVSVSFNSNHGDNDDYSSHISGIANTVESIKTNLDRLRDDERVLNFNKNIRTVIQKFANERKTDRKNTDTFKSNLLKELNK